MRRAREARQDGPRHGHHLDPSSSTTTSNRTNNSIYHRNKSMLPASRRSTSTRSKAAVFLPILLFATILGLAFLVPPPPPPNHMHTSSAMIHMLQSSKFRVQQQQEQEPAISEDPSEDTQDDDAASAEEEPREKVAQVPLDSSSGMTRVILPHESINVPWSQTASSEDFPSTTKKNDLTLFLQSTADFDNGLLDRVFPSSTSRAVQPETFCPHIPSLFLPIDEFPSEDPFLPWIHDYFYAAEFSNSSSQQHSQSPYAGRIQFVAQNRRRCQTGKGKEAIMKHWEPQMTLFQAIPISLQPDGYVQMADSLRNATIPETRLVCHFHDHVNQQSFVTFSQFNFNYEYVLWRKRSHSFQSMFVEKGKDTEQFELSQLLFSCPVPREVVLFNSNHPNPQWKLDLIPLRTRARRDGEMLLTEAHVGPKEFRTMAQSKKENIQSTPLQAGPKILLEDLLTKSGRWANLPLCLDESDRLLSRTPTKTTRQVAITSNKTANSVKDNYMVACTWTAANYFRRGDATAITDAAQRIREWIAFHKLVGFDHLYIYDNTLIDHNATIQKTIISPIRKVMEKEYANDDKVTYIPWPCRVCSNNRPNHPNPGERSSQYAAEASCRERFGESAEFMSFIDIDEFFVPMMTMSDGVTRVTSLRSVLEKKKQEGHQVLKLRSSRARPRIDLMELVPEDSQEVCVPQGHSKYPIEPCLRPRSNETLLRVYNCEYIRSPKPERFQRAMKQIYRPDFVFSHFVHYSTITKPMTEYFSQKTPLEQTLYEREVSTADWGDVFLNELDEAVLVHAKAIVPHETVYRSSICKLESKQSCPLGFVCPESTPFVDSLHKKNVFKDEEGKFCNCWINHHLEDTLIPQMEALLQQ